MKSIEICRKLVPLKMGAVGYFLLVMHSYHLYTAHITDGISHFYFTLNDAYMISLSYATLFLSFQFIRLIFNKNTGTRIVGNMLFLLFYAVMSAYLFSAKSSLDFAVIIDNIDSTFSQEAISVVLSSFNWAHLKITISSILVLLVLEIGKKTISKIKHPQPFWPKFFITGGLLLTFLFSPLTLMTNSPISFNR
ncbi:MAG: hypothetical protein JSW20_08455 [Nitrospiraceae bacterium]|nr:MAG: hypothetical protein JSW20_08455 [Nitrospiraceae bacterium]